MERKCIDLRDLQLQPNTQLGLLGESSLHTHKKTTLCELHLRKTSISLGGRGSYRPHNTPVH